MDQRHSWKIIALGFGLLISTTAYTNPPTVVGVFLIIFFGAMIGAAIGAVIGIGTGFCLKEFRTTLHWLGYGLLFLDLLSKRYWYS